MKTHQQYNGDDKSKEWLKELLDIQAEQLEEWKSVLKDEAFAFLKSKVEAENAKILADVLTGTRFNIHDSVKRGVDLDNIIGNLAIRNTAKH